MKNLWFAAMALVVGACEGGTTHLNGPAPLLDAAFVGSNRTGSPLSGPATSVAASTLIEEFYAAAQLARDHKTDMPIQLAAFNAGAAVVNARCQIYFRSLGLDARNMSFAQSQIQLLTGGLTTILALTAASPVAVAAVAAGATALLTGMKQFGDAYYFSADPTAVEQLVVKAQTEALASINTVGNRPIDFSAMTMNLVSYQTICQPHSIRHLINSAVTNGKPVPLFSSPTLPGVNTEALLLSIYESLGVAGVSNAQVAIIYQAFRTDPSDENFPALCGYVSRLLRGSFTNTGSAADGVCPAGSGVSVDEAWAAKRAAFNRFYSLLRASNPTYWSDLETKVRAAKTIAQLSAVSPSTSTPAPAGAPVPVAAPMPAAAAARTVRGAPAAAAPAAPMGRMGGFVITVQ